jgi:hypothetical protein
MDKGNPLSGFADGGAIDFGNWTSCTEYLANTPGINSVVGRCNLVAGADGRFSQKVQCLNNDTYLPCLNNVTGPLAYATFGVFSDSVCSAQTSAASQFVGSYAIQEGQCLPLDYSKPTQAPFFLANCTSGDESFRLYSNANCTQPLAAIASSPLNGQCLPFPLVTGLTMRGTCNTCPPPLPPPAPVSSGLSGGAIAGIVIGCLAGLAALGGIAYALSRKKAVVPQDYPLEKPTPVVVKEVVEPTNVQSAQTVSTPVVTNTAPVVASSVPVTTTVASAPVIKEVSTVGATSVQQFIRTYHH